jgi:hypothetical protein
MRAPWWWPSTPAARRRRATSCRRRRLELLRGVARVLAALPNSAKAILLVGAVVALTHPGSRKWITERCADVGVAIAPGWDALTGALAAAATLHHESRLAADGHLAIAMGLVRPRPVATPVRRTRTRRRARFTQPAPRAFPKT